MTRSTTHGLSRGLLVILAAALALALNLLWTTDANPIGSKIVSVTLPDGSSLDPTATYTVAVNGYLATGGDGFTVFEEGQNVQTVGGDLEALVAYIQSLPQPFEAPADFGQRIIRLN